MVSSPFSSCRFIFRSDKDANILIKYSTQTVSHQHHSKIILIIFHSHDLLFVSFFHILCCRVLQNIQTILAPILQALTLIQNVCMHGERMPGIMCGTCIVYTLFAASDISKTCTKKENREMQKENETQIGSREKSHCIKERNGIVCTLNATDHTFLPCKPVSKTLDNFRFVVELLSMLMQVFLLRFFLSSYLEIQFTSKIHASRRSFHSSEFPMNRMSHVACPFFSIHLYVTVSSANAHHHGQCMSCASMHFLCHFKPIISSKP